MLAKLLALLAQSKGGVVAVVFLAGATTATVAATNPDVQNTFEQLTNSSNVSQQSNDCDHGQPAVVAQRNAADKLLRDAYQKDHKALEDMRGKGGATNDLVRQYDDQLRSDLNKGLNKVAGLTLGRNGQDQTTTTTTQSGTTPTPTPTPVSNTSTTTNTTCVQTAGSTAPSSPNANTSPTTSSNDLSGRAAVAARTTLDAQLQQIVDDTVKAMDTDVQDATTALQNAVPAPDHGKPNDNPGNKPDNAGKPTASPKH